MNTNCQNQFCWFETLLTFRFPDLNINVELFTPQSLTNFSAQETNEKILDFVPPALVIQPPSAAAVSVINPKTNVPLSVTPPAVAPQVKLTENQLSSMLSKHKELLRKDIAEKRSQLAQDLYAEINKVRVTLSICSVQSISLFIPLGKDDVFGKQTREK